MKHFSIILLLSFAWVHAQNVAINDNGSVANTNAILDVDVASNNKGVLIPRLTSAQRIAIPGLGAADQALLVYDETTDSFWYWDGTQWVEISNGNNEWELLGNAGTNPAINFVGTTDNTDLVVRTNSVEAMRVASNGNVGIGTPTPAHKLHVVGDTRIFGNFVNQDLIGSHSGTVQSIPFTNAVFNPLTGTTTSITITDGNGVNNSGVFISGFARVFGGNLNGSNSSLGGYFLILERADDAAFTVNYTILTYTSGNCYIETPNGVVSAAIGYGDGGHVSYTDNNLAPGTYYYRLTLYPNGVGITSGTYDVYQRDLSIIQIKR